MKRRNITIFISMLLGAALLSGCGGKKTVYDSLYTDLSEELYASDPSVLAGRRIVVDPGHGGEYDGAIGADSLSEAEVNLGVALYLWGLLSDAGAEVHMTRSSDRDFLPAGAAAPGTDLAAMLKDDLAGRIEKANEFDPEVFISIHHNSNIALDRQRNGIEIYYRGTDHGASLELATDIHTHLARNLGIETTTIKTGNYYVLRNSKAGASVLGEASYLSNPEVEEKLKLSTKQKLEAEAYYLGLVEYFSNGVPMIEAAGPGMDTLTAPAKFEFFVQPGAGVPVDPASFEAKINGTRIDCFQPGDGGNPFCIMPASIPNGSFTVSFSARSVRGRTATFGPKKMLLDRPARFFLPMPAVPYAGGGKNLIVLVLDAGGRPVADGRKVTMNGPGGKDGSSSLTRKGNALFIRKNTAGPYIISSGSAVDTLAFDDAGSGSVLLTVAINDLTMKEIPEAVLLFADGTTARADRKGWIRSAKTDTAGAVVYAPGYLSAPLAHRAGDETGELHPTRMTPLFEGALHGKRIVIDPAGGGTEDAGRGAGALRGATVNMRLARELEKLLTLGGATVLVTRNGEEQLSDQQRIFRVNRFGADLAIGLMFGGHDETLESCLVSHYPGSVRGTFFADSLAAGLAGTPPCKTFVTSESAALFLQQTNCPAIIISGGALSDEGTEKILGSFRWTGMETEAILRSLVNCFDKEE